MPIARVLWVAPSGHRPNEVPASRLVTCDTKAAALTTLDSCSTRGDHMDAVVAAPALPDGDGGIVLRAVRDRWPDAACFLHGDLWAIPEGSSLPVCEFHPASQPPENVAEAVAEAVRGRYHRPYPVPAPEDRRLAVIDDLDLEGSRSELERLATRAEADTGADVAFVSVVEDHTVRFPVASEELDRTVLRRGDSACTYAIDEDDLTVIDDVRSDDRFAHLDDCSCLGMRSYAGRPLSVDGVPVGTLALLADDPGAFSGSRLEPLAEYAADAERILASTA